VDEDADGNVSLTIHNTAPSDKGVYTVKATNSYGDAKCFANVIVKPVVHQEVNIPPSFKEVLTDKTVNKDDTVLFQCVVVGRPTPQVSSSAPKEEEVEKEQSRPLTFRNLLTV
jgi:hypothetical protein